MVATTYYSNPMNEPFLDLHLYRSIVGGLQYLKFTCHYSLACSLHSGASCLFRCRPRLLSTTGFCTFLGGSNCIEWCNTKQPMVASSSAYAKYYTLASAAAKLTWYSLVLRDIGAFLAQPPTWFSDNISTLHHSINLVLHKTHWNWL